MLDGSRASDCSSAKRGSVAAEHQVRDQAVILPGAALDDHEGALLHFLRRDGQPHAEVFFNPPPTI
jgi:hypothetical protein